MNACEKRIDERLSEQTAADEKKTPQRDARGRFAAGNSGGPGNPFGRYTAKLREALVTAVTEEDMQAIVRKMIDMAKVGSIPAMRLVMQYVIGKPTSAPNPDRVQIDEWNVHKETAAMTPEVPNVVKSLEPEACLEMARDIRPILSAAAMQKYARDFAETPAPTPTAPDSFDGDAPTRSDRQVNDAAPPVDFDGGWVHEVRQVDAEATPRGFDGDAVAGHGQCDNRVLPSPPGEVGPGARGFQFPGCSPPHPQPLSPEGRGEQSHSLRSGQ